MLWSILIKMESDYWKLLLRLLHMITWGLGPKAKRKAYVEGIFTVIEITYRLHVNQLHMPTKFFQKSKDNGIADFKILNVQCLPTHSNCSFIRLLMKSAWHPHIEIAHLEAYCAKGPLDLKPFFFLSICNVDLPCRRSLLFSTKSYGSFIA